MPEIFTELALVLAVSAGISLVLAYLRQPSIAAYIATGALLGPFGLRLLSQNDILHDLSSVGVALLLFLVGLELNTSELKKYGKKAVVAGIAQVILTTGFGFGIAYLLGFSLLTSVYVALALTFSSTILVIKILTEKKDLQSLSGRLVIGIFLTQDFVALVLLILLSGSGNGGNLQTLILTALKGVGFIFSAWWLGKHFLEKLLQKFGKSDELLQILVLGWGLGLAALAATPLFGFSLEIGGLIAGLSLSSSTVHHQINAKVRSLRDFFLVLFFTVLGAQINFAHLLSSLGPALWLGIFVLIGNPIIVIFLLAKLGYRSRTAFLTAVTVGQVSEFSLILGALGKSLGHISDTTFDLLAIISVGTMIISSFMITHSERLYEHLKKILEKLPIWYGHAEHEKRDEVFKNHIVIVGAHQMGSRLAEVLHKKMQVLVVDFDPENVEKLRKMGLTAICGDAADKPVQELAGLDKAKVVISTLPQLQDNLALAENLQTLKKKPKLIVSCHLDSEAPALYAGGFDYVILPHQLSSMHLSHILSGENPTARLKQLKNKHQ